MSRSSMPSPGRRERCAPTRPAALGGSGPAGSGRTGGSTARRASSPAPARTRTGPSGPATQVVGAHVGAVAPRVPAQPRAAASAPSPADVHRPDPGPVPATGQPDGQQFGARDRSRCRQQPARAGRTPTVLGSGSDVDHGLARRSRASSETAELTSSGAPISTGTSRCSSAPATTSADAEHEAPGAARRWPRQVRVAAGPPRLPAAAAVGVTAESSRLVAAGPGTLAEQLGHHLHAGRGRRSTSPRAASAGAPAPRRRTP